MSTGTDSDPKANFESPLRKSAMFIASEPSSSGSGSEERHGDYT